MVTVADAKWLRDRLRDAPEAKNQIAFADVILLNKTDLVTPEELREVEARIRGINPYAKLHRTQRAQIPLERSARAAMRSISNASSTSSRNFSRPTIMIMTTIIIMGTITIMAIRMAA